jgi:hypothetical protein
LREEAFDMMATSALFQSCAEDMSPLLNLPFELRTKVWFYCVTNACAIAEILSPNLFESFKYQYNGQRPYFVFMYSFRSEGVLIWGIRKLPIIFASKMSFLEVVPIVQANASLSFRGLDFWDLDRLRRMPECKRVRKVTVGFGKEELREGDEGASEHLESVMKWLGGFEEGVRMFVRLDEAAVRLLVKGDERLAIFAKLLESEILKEGVEHCFECEGCYSPVSWTVEWVKDSTGVLLAKS